MKVLISGAGIGGLTLAAFLEKLDIDYDIIEKRSKYAGEGFSLGMWNNARDILDKLDLANKFDEHGQPEKKYIIKGTRGELIKRFDMRVFLERYGAYHTLVDRGELHDWLIDRADAQRLSYETTIQAIKQKEDAVTITFSDGSEANYSLVVGADGVHSNTRNLVFPNQNFEDYRNWRSWWVVADYSYCEPEAVVEYIGPSQFIGVFDNKDESLINLHAPADNKQRDFANDRIDRILDHFSHQNSIIPAILKDKSPEEITPTDISAVRMNKWYEGKVVLLGDAAHAMEPYAGIGGSMAMEDAYVLAGKLFQYDRNNKSLRQALAEKPKRAS
jgi:2-polyprenyl-6-methoxyphenol hydroxylase-like FAD-dependent oxidoreductase